MILPGETEDDASMYTSHDRELINVNLLQLAGHKARLNSDRKDTHNNTVTQDTITDREQNKQQVTAS